MRILVRLLNLTLVAGVTCLVACADDTPRAQTPQTTTGPYNTGTTATPGLSASKAAGATGEGGPVGPIAPAPAMGVAPTGPSGPAASPPRP
jgi:hypothetical protein